MSKLLVVFALCALLGLVAGRQMLVGAPIQASENDEDVQRALAFAVNTFNKGTNDIYMSKLNKVNEIKKQVVSGLNFIMDLDLGRTHCRKPTADVQQCNLHTEPSLAKSSNCKFVVYWVPWLGTMKVTEQKCGN